MDIDYIGLLGKSRTISGAGHGCKISNISLRFVLVESEIPFCFTTVFYGSSQNDCFLIWRQGAVTYKKCAHI